MQNQPIARLTFDKRHRKYNETVRKKLAEAGIPVTETTTKFSRVLTAPAEYELAAAKIVLAIPHPR